MKNNFVKQFVMPVVVLLAICIVCVGILAVLNDVLYVYVETAYETVSGQIIGSEENADGSYTIEALGKNGYQSGTVTMDVTISADGEITALTIVRSDAQSWIDMVTQESLDAYYLGETADSAVDYDKLGGASYTSTAINNAVNVAIEYFNILTGGAN